MRNLSITFLFLFLSTLTSAQELDTSWSFSSIKNQNKESLFEIDSTDTFTLDKGAFEYQLKAKDLKASGTYIRQNNLLIFNYQQPKDTVRYYNIVSLSDDRLILSEGGVYYAFSSVMASPEEVVAVTNIEQPKENVIIPSQGFSVQSLWRGILGMIVLIIIAFLFSANRLAIQWKKVGIGLALQLLIAIGVLKVNFVKAIFEFVGGIFIEILEYTKAGSKFLFEGLVADMNTFGYIFAFQVLQTIIFFSALTSLLF